MKSELRALDEKIIVSGSELTRTQADNANMEAQMRGYESKVPLGELKRRISELKREVATAEEKIEALNSSRKPAVSKEDKAKGQKELDKYAREWRKLKRIATEMMAIIIENCNMKKDQLCVSCSTFFLET